MADPDRKVKENIAGRFYVDETCIDCEACREIAHSSRGMIRGDTASSRISRRIRLKNPPVERRWRNVPSKRSATTGRFDQAGDVQPAREDRPSSSSRR